MKTLDKAIFAVGLVGYACMVAGLALLRPWLGFVVGGLIAMAWSAWMARAVAAERARGGRI